MARTVLVLHGYSQNASIFSKRLGALRKECGKNVELVFIDAPHILQPVDLDSFSSQIQSPAASSANADPSLTPRGWWTSNPSRTKASGLDESLAFVRDVLKNRRFEGIFGFSQGAAFAALIAALLERPHVYQPFLIDGQPPHPPLQFCIVVSGFKVSDPISDRIFTSSFATPTLHILGRTDVVVVEERSRLLIDISAKPRVEEHEGGHFVPSKASWRKFLCDYMKDPFVDHLSPSSAISSGQTTPA